MPDIHNTDTNELRRSVDITRQPLGPTERTIARAETEQIEAIPLRYRKWTGSAVVEMDAIEKAAEDAKRDSARRDAAVAVLDAPGDGSPAIDLALLHLLNDARAALVPPQRAVTVDELKALARGELT